MNRRKFLVKVVAPAASACAVCLSACTKNSEKSTSNNTPIILLPFTVDLQTNLLTIGSEFKKNGVIIVRMAAGNMPSSFIAFQSDCTHAAGTLAWNINQNQFVCPVHGSTFAANGTVTNGPAATALKSYTITINGNLMTINQ